MESRSHINRMSRQQSGLGLSESNLLEDSDLFNFEAGVLDDVPHHGHDLGRELPLLLLQGGAGGLGVRLPVGNEDMVGRNVGEQ